MNAIVNWWKARSLRVRVALVAGLSVLLLGLAGGLGARLFPRMETVTVTDTTATEQVKRLTQENTDLTEDLARTQNKLISLQQLKVTTVHRVKAPGGQVTEDITTKVTSNETTQAQTVTVDTKVATSNSSTATTDVKASETKTTVTVTPVPDPRFHAAVGVGVLPFRGAGFAANVALDARILGPIYVGAWSTVPVNDLAGTAVGLSLGVRF